MMKSSRRDTGSVPVSVYLSISVYVIVLTHSLPIPVSLALFTPPSLSAPLFTVRHMTVDRPRRLRRARSQISQTGQRQDMAWEG